MAQKPARSNSRIMERYTSRPRSHVTVGKQGIPRRRSPQPSKRWHGKRSSCFTPVIFAWSVSRFIFSQLQPSALVLGNHKRKQRAHCLHVRIQWNVSFPKSSFPYYFEEANSAPRQRRPAQKNRRDRGPSDTSARLFQPSKKAGFPLFGKPALTFYLVAWSRSLKVLR